MAQVRRKFNEVEKARPNRKASKGSAASHVKGLIGRLYAVEKRTRDLPSECRCRVRPDVAKPLLEQLHTWLRKSEPRVPSGVCSVRR